LVRSGDCGGLAVEELSRSAPPVFIDGAPGHPVL
jgi:hypothetical protein